MGVAILALAACSSKSASSGAASPAATIPCALAGARAFTAECAIERSSLDGRAILTLRHPDGGFRRLIELETGKRFVAADGSDEVAIEPNGREIEVTLGDDHYLLPAPASAVPNAAQR